MTDQGDAASIPDALTQQNAVERRQSAWSSVREAMRLPASDTILVKNEVVSV